MLLLAEKVSSALLSTCLFRRVCSPSSSCQDSWQTGGEVGPGWWQRDHQTKPRSLQPDVLGKQEHTSRWWRLLYSPGGYLRLHYYMLATNTMQITLLHACNQHHADRLRVNKTMNIRCLQGASWISLTTPWTMTWISAQLDWHWTWLELSLAKWAKAIRCSQSSLF